MKQIKHSFTNDLFNHSRPNDPKRSKFDLSRITNFTADAGMIIPFDHFLTLPGDDFDISFEMVLDTLPLSAPSLTGYKVVTHWYYIEMKDLWKGWQTFITRGRTGNINLTLPYVVINKPCFVSSEEDFSGNVYPTGYHSLSSFLGVPPSLTGGSIQRSDGLVKGFYKPYTLVEDDDLESRFIDNISTLGDFRLSTRRFNVNALPFMAYQNICKHNYVPQNLLQDNKALFPDEGDQDWILPYSANECNLFPIDEIDNSHFSGIFHSSDKSIRLDYLRYAIFDDDYFTSALPWLQRGDAQTLSIDLGVYNIDSSDAVSSAHVNGVTYSNLYLNNDSDMLSSGIYNNNDNTNPNLISALNKLKINLSNTQVGITANNLRQLLAMSVWQERNARVNGAYNGMIYQHWSVNPRDVEHKPIYIGGTADYVSFQTILQNSASTSDSPLGSTAGRGSVSPNSQFVGKFHCNDYGFIFGIMIIKPDATYSQGIERHLNQMSTFEDWVQPEFEGLSPEPIYNSELFFDYDDDTDSKNNGLFGYQERYTYLKVRMNQNRGLFYANPTKERLFSAYSQARNFTSLPKLSYQFVVMSPSNIRRDMLAYPEYPMFRLQTRSDVKVVRSLSYTSEPNTFGF